MRGGHYNCWHSSGLPGWEWPEGVAKENVRPATDSRLGCHVLQARGTARCVQVCGTV
jgi:hypothetical protein